MTTTPTYADAVDVVAANLAHIERQTADGLTADIVKALPDMAGRFTVSPTVTLSASKTISVGLDVLFDDAATAAEQSAVRAAVAAVLGQG